MPLLLMSTFPALTGLGYLVLLQEHVQLLDGDTQVSLVELVGDVPAHGAELPPLLGQGVEEAQAVQQLLKHHLGRRHTRIHAYEHSAHTHTHIHAPTAQTNTVIKETNRVNKTDTVSTAWAGLADDSCVQGGTAVRTNSSTPTAQELLVNTPHINAHTPTTQRYTLQP